MIASRSCCKFVGWTSMMWISRSTRSQRCSIDWDLVTVEAIWVKWTHCHVQETSLRGFELCDMVHYPAGSSHQKIHGSDEGMDMVSNNTQGGLAFKKCSIGTKKYPPHHYTTTSSSSLNSWDKAGWIHAFMFFTPNSDPTILMSQQKSRLIRPGNFFQSSIV